MEYEEVLSYGVWWDLNQHKGEIKLNFANGGSMWVGRQTPDEMHMLIDFLRNEKPVYLDLDSRSLFFPSTYGEPMEIERK